MTTILGTSNLKQIAPNKLVHKKVYDNLRAAEKEIRPLGLSLLILKAFDSESLEYSEGTAIDLVLTDMLTGEPLDTPNGEESSEEARLHEAILKIIMMKYGFEPLENKWCHFNLKGCISYSVIESELDEL